MERKANFLRLLPGLLMFLGGTLDVAARPPLAHEAQDPRAQAHSDLTVLSHEAGMTMVIGEGRGPTPDLARGDATIVAEDRLIAALHQRFRELVEQTSNVLAGDSGALNALGGYEDAFQVESIPYEVVNTKVFEERGQVVCLRLLALSDSNMDRIILGHLQGEDAWYALVRYSEPIRDLEGRVDTQDSNH